MSFFFGSVIGFAFGWLIGNMAGYSLWITIPVSWLVVVFAFSYIGVSLEENKLKKKVSNLPSVSTMFNEICQRPSKLSNWEQDFIQDITDKTKDNPNFLSKKASIKQLNIIAQIYIERIRGAKLKGREYTLEAVDSETGEVKTLTINSSK